MDLKNNLYTETGWDIAENSFDEEQIVTTGSNFMLGNGYLGYRGTFAEWEADQYVACIVTDTYDRVDGKWRELCNAPNSLYTKLIVDGEELSAFDGEIREYTRALDLRHGLFKREQTWQSVGGKVVRLKEEKFASYDNPHLLTMTYSFQVDQDTEVMLITGIDGRVWNLHGEHFREYRLLREDDLVAVETVTVERGIQLDVVEGLTIHGREPDAVEIIEADRRILRKLTFRLPAGDEVTLEKVAGIYHTNDVDAPLQVAVADVKAALDEGYDKLKGRHQARWDAIWDVTDIQIEGDLEAQTTTRFNLYQAVIATPTHAKLPIGARGLSCQAYQGSAFWDQEIFNMPMFLYTRPEVARNILEYRHVTLDGARQKAKDLGYYGAFYAWVSGKTGEELCPSYFFTDVLTGRKIHNHFNDWQIHISPDIVYAIWHYYRATGDWDFVVDYGAEIAFEVAQFLVSHAYFKKDKNRYEFIRLLGPDEYHENVDNNAFTNYQARFALDTASTIYSRLKEIAPDKLNELFARLDLDEEDVDNWCDMVNLIYLPQPDEETLLLEQFDGYFEFEDVFPEDLEERLQHPQEYWGWPNGVAVETQVLKQADVLQLFALHDHFPADVQRANYDYYEPRTQHGSSLSPSVHSVVANRVGYTDEAYRYFVTSSTIDLYNTSKAVSGGTFIGGIHTAACGAVWQMVVKGFAGFAIDDSGIAFEPALPKHWQRVEFKLVFHRNLLDVSITADEVTLSAAENNEGKVHFRVYDVTDRLNPGEEKRLAYG